jgi:pilus assembly protein CpaE
MMNTATQTGAVATASGDSIVALVPRINIHVFCDNQQTAEVLQAAAVDRRMTKAHVTLQLGGIMAAVQVYQAQATPNLLIVESHGSREVILSELAQLAQVCQPTTKVVVIGHLNDVVLYRELIKQGVSEYLVAPLHQMQIIECIANLYHDPKAPPIGKVLAFVGAKGGVGSSTIAHNFAWLMSKRHATDTVITDLDLAFGTAGLNFNQDSAGGIVDALAQPDRVDATLIDRLLTKLGDKLSLLSGPGVVDREFSIESHAVDTILSAIRSSVPCVVVDVPNMWAPWIKYTLVHADQVIITATPDLPSLRNTKNLVDLLKQSRPNDRPPKVILNQVGVPKRPEISPADFAKAIGTDVTATIPYDAQTFGTAQSNGTMIFEVSAKSKAAEALAAFVQSTTGTDKPAKATKLALHGLVSKLPLLSRKK